MSKAVERLNQRGAARAKRAEGAAKRAYVNVWVKMGTLIRDELPKLRGAPLSVLVYLASRMDKKYQCNPSQELIAKQTGCHERQVRYALAYLKAQGFIHYGRVDWTNCEGRQPCTVYTITKRYECNRQHYPLFEYGLHTRGKSDDKGDDEDSSKGDTVEIR